MDGKSERSSEITAKTSQGCEPDGNSYPYGVHEFDGCLWGQHRRPGDVGICLKSCVCKGKKSDMIGMSAVQ